MENSLKSPALSLSDLLTGDYIKAVCEARGFLKKEDPGNFLKVAEERVEFFPAGFAARLDELVEYVGQKVAKEITDSPEGATTNAFHKATSTVKAPVSALGLSASGKTGGFIWPPRASIIMHRSDMIFRDINLSKTPAYWVSPMRPTTIPVDPLPVCWKQNWYVLQTGSIKMTPKD